MELWQFIFVRWFSKKKGWKSKQPAFWTPRRSVASTVGYGNVTPKTENGRKLTIILAIIGIPVYGILLRKINAQVERWIFHLKEKNKEKKFIFSRKSIIFLYIVFGMIIFVILPSVIFSFVEEWTYLDAIYFSITTISKVNKPF